MATPSPGNSITVRVVSPSGAQATGQLTAAIAAAGGALTALDVVESHHDRLVIDVTCNTTDDEHAKASPSCWAGCRDSRCARSVTAPS